MHEHVILCVQFMHITMILSLPMIFTDKGDPTPGGHVKNLHPLKSVTLYRGKNDKLLPQQIIQPN